MTSAVALGGMRNLYGTTGDSMAQESFSSWPSTMAGRIGSCQLVVAMRVPMFAASALQILGIVWNDGYSSTFAQFGCSSRTVRQIFLTIVQTGGNLLWNDTYNPNPGPYYNYAGYDVFNDLAVDAAGTVYGTEGWVNLPTSITAGSLTSEPGRSTAGGFAGDDWRLERGERQPLRHRKSWRSIWPGRGVGDSRRNWNSAGTQRPASCMDAGLF